MRTWLLKNIARLSYRYPYELLFIAFLFTLVAVYGVFKLEIEANVIKLLPEDSPQATAFRRALQDFGAFDYMLVLIEAKQKHQEEKLFKVAEAFSQAIDDRSYISSIDYKLDSELLSLFQQYSEERLVYLLTEKDWQEIIERLKPEAIRKQLNLLKHRLMVVSGQSARKMTADPLDLSRILRHRLLHTVGPTQLNLRQGYFISRDGSMLMMVVKPVHPSTDVLFNERLMSFLHRSRQGVLARAGEGAGDVAIHFAGSHVEAYNDTRLIRRDLLTTSIASFTFVLMLFILAFRRLEALLFVGIPLMVSILWTLGLTSLIFGRLTIVTFSFVPVLIGLTIDFAIHIYNRFIEEVEKGRQIHPALRLSIIRTGKGILTGALTTAVAFYCMNFASFKGYQELGTVAGNGILCGLTAIYMLLPAMVVLKWQRQKERVLPLHIGNFHLDLITRHFLKYPRLVVILAIIITVYLGYWASGLRFNQNIRQLRQHSVEYTALKRRLKQQFPLPGNQVIAIVNARSIEKALEKNDRLYENIAVAKESYPILSCDSLRTILPARETQLHIQQLFCSLDLDKIKEEILKEGEGLGFNAHYFAPFFQRLERLQDFARQGEIITFGSLRSPLLWRLVQRYMVHSGSAYRVVAYIYPYEGNWVYEVPEEALRQLRQGIDQIEFTGVTILANALEHKAKIDLALVVILVSLIVFLIALFHFGKVNRTLMAVIPTFCGTLWMLGTMSILGIEMNFLNIIVVPMIIGLAVDDGIHLVGRYYELRKYDLYRAVEFTGRAVVMVSLTTMLGFGSLALASFRGIREMGLLAILGVGYALFTSIIVLPAMLKIWGKHYRLSEFFAIEEGEIH